MSAPECGEQALALASLSDEHADMTAEKKSAGRGTLAFMVRLRTGYLFASHKEKRREMGV